MGWLYVIKGSNLGAAFLLKAAKMMGLSEGHGATHLAEAPEGRAVHWRKFKDVGWMVSRLMIQKKPVSSPVPMARSRGFARWWASI